MIVLHVNSDTVHVLMMLFSRVTLFKHDAIDVICLISIVCSVYDLNRMQYFFFKFEFGFEYSLALIAGLYDVVFRITNYTYFGLFHAIIKWVNKTTALVPGS